MAAPAASNLVSDETDWGVLLEADDDGDWVDPPEPGEVTMSPRTPAAQELIDQLVGDQPIDHARFDEAMKAFRDATAKSTRVQRLWQCGDIIRLVAVDRPDRSAKLDRVVRMALDTLDRMRIDHYDFDRAVLQGRLGDTGRLLLLVYYAPIYPDLATALDLTKRIVRAIAADAAIAQNWIATVVWAEGGRFYIRSVHTWFHVMRRDHTRSIAAWLFASGPLPVQVDTIAPIDLISGLLSLPADIRDLALNAILHAHTRERLLRLVDETASREWWPEAGQLRDEINRHVAMHMPLTDGAPSVDQSQVMDALVEQMARTAATDIPFDIAGLVMDYVRRDDSARVDKAKLTRYKQAENDYLRARIGAVGVDLAAERVATAAARTAPASSRSREERGGEEEEEKQRTQHARISARFLSSAPALHW